MLCLIKTEGWRDVRLIEPIRMDRKGVTDRVCYDISVTQVDILLRYSRVHTVDHKK